MIKEEIKEKIIKITKDFKKSRQDGELFRSLHSHYGIDITAELEKKLVDELSRDIDKKILENLFKLRV